MDVPFFTPNSPTSVMPLDIPKPRRYFGPPRMDSAETQDENPLPVPPSKPTFREPYKIHTEERNYKPLTYLHSTFGNQTKPSEEPLFSWHKPKKICTDVTKEDLGKCEYNPIPIEDLFDVGQNTWDSVNGLLGRWAEGKGPKLDSSEIVPCSPPKRPFYPKPQLG